MARQRFYEKYPVGKEIGTHSFFGEFVYEQIVPRDHFLMKLNQVVKWERRTKRLIRYYRARVR